MRRMTPVVLDLLTERWAACRVSVADDPQTQVDLQHLQDVPAADC